MSSNRSESVSLGVQPFKSDDGENINNDVICKSESWTVLMAFHLCP